MDMVLARVQVYIDGFYGHMFTGKLVKAIIINAEPSLVEHFKPVKGGTPKLIHISPLYDSNGRCVYSHLVCKQRKHVVKCSGEPNLVEVSGKHYFYFGFHTSVVKPDILRSILNYTDHFEFMKQNVKCEVLGIEVYNPYSLSERLAGEIIKQGGLKLVFSSPTMLRDPLRIRSRFKTYLPTPENVFAIPIYSRLLTKGRYTTATLRRELLRLRRLLHETYSVFGGLRVRWVYYGRKPEPALVGFVNYRLNTEYLEYLKQKGINVEEWLGEVFAYTLTLGVGAGRAAGFGHVELKPLRTG